MHQVKYGSALAGGKVTVPPSKSAAIRALLCAALSGGGATLYNMAPSEDILATLGAIRALGLEAQLDEEGKAVYTQTSALGFASGGEIDCRESGSLVRFIIPIAAALGGCWCFRGRGRLPKRPLGVYADLLPKHGVEFNSQGGLPLEIRGKLTPGEFSLPGNISSQFVTGLLFALPLLAGDSKIQLTSPLESRGYVDMTLSILQDFGVNITPNSSGWYIPGGQKYLARTYTVEGDWSHAAFFLNLAALAAGGPEIRIMGLNPDSLQGDRACLEVFGCFGLHTHWEEGELVAKNLHSHKPFGGLTGQTIDVSQITDMVPAASICAALSQGETRFVNAGRLRLKESDRIMAMENAINALGGRASSREDELIIQGVERFSGGLAEGCNDHRVIMALAGAGLRSGAPVLVSDAWSIQKTYPQFFDDLKRLGGEADVIQLG